MATAFESWMVTEHHNRGYPSHLLGDTFRVAVWAAGTVAVVSGFLAEAAVQRAGLLAPFQLAIGVSSGSLPSSVSIVNSSNLAQDQFQALATPCDCLAVLHCCVIT